MKMLGVKIDKLSLNEVLNKVKGFLEDGKSHYIVTPNPEFLVKAQKDEEFFKILNKADLSVPDGIGLVFASLLLGEKIKERVTGVDLMEAICKKAAKKKWPVFLFGAGPGVAERARENLRGRYKKLKVFIINQSENKNSHPDFFERFTLKGSDASQKNLDCSLLHKSPSILFVALGAPKQEKWINENLKKMPNIKLAVGVGGAFDFISERVKRAPEFMKALGLEWFWRLIIQPWRIKRIFNALIVFPYLVFKEKIKNR